MHDLLFVMMGSECKSAVISERNKIAFHEAGHVLVAIHTDGAPPVRVATIIPTVGAGCQQPDMETNLSHKEMLARLDIYMG
ncbi:ATP-dependent zinc metalloprotease FTSH 4 mitochondrial-like, partial [Trifolium medium]|nr:ATP-dependent zinc metalloprotease FTSH 4 mitochondrial-like [Trifolium medium]